MTTRSIWNLVLVGVLAGASTFPRGGQAAPSEAELETFEAPSEPARSAVAGLAIWVEESIPEADQLRAWIEERAQQVLQARGRELEAVEVIHVAVRGGPYDYKVHIGLVRNKRLIANQLQPFPCACGSDEMLEKVGAAIGEGADRLAKAAEAERTEAVAERNRAYLVAEERDEWERQGTRQPDGAHLGPLGLSGIGLSIVGLGAFATGIPLATRPEDFERTGRRGVMRPADGVGVGVAIVGSLMLGGGIAMLVMDRVRRGDRRVAVGPTVGPSGAGLTVGGSF